MKRIFLKYITWKYGHIPYSLMPPLGHPFFRYWLWRVEKKVFNWWCRKEKDAWLRWRDTCLLMSLMLAAGAPAATIGLEWDPSPSTNVLEYVIYDGTNALQRVGADSTHCALTNLAPGVHTFTVTATATNLSATNGFAESDRSNPARVEVFPEVRFWITPRLWASTNLRDFKIRTNLPPAPFKAEAGAESYRLDASLQAGNVTIQQGTNAQTFISR